MNSQDVLQQTKYEPETFKYHPMYHTWCIDLKSAFIDAVKNNPNCSSETLQRVIDKVSTCQGFTVYNVGDQQFGEKWLMISKCLAELYIKVRWMLARYGCEPHMAEMYREKYDQALDWLSGQKQDVPPLLKCGLTKKVTVEEIDYIANSVLRRRSQWLDMLNQIEHIRLTAKREIIQGQDCNTVRNVMLNAIDLLTKLDTQYGY